MARRIYLLVPGATVFALLACGGASDPGLFSGSGSSAGDPGSAAGASDSAGASASAGSPSSQGGSSVGGSVGVAGEPAGGTNSGAAGAQTGGSAGSAEHAGAGGSAAGESSSAGSGGNAAGGSAGSTGSAGSGGSTAGSGGSGGTELTCSELLAQAAKQLQAARACNVAKNAEQCTGKVKTCNCDVPVENEDSAETQAYEATLKQINQKKCVQVCPALACTPVNRAQCRASSAASTAGTCVSNFGVQPL